MTQNTVCLIADHSGFEMKWTDSDVFFPVEEKIYKIPETYIPT